MADKSFKSKLPAAKEVAEMATKLFKDIKKSVNEIVVDYKTKHKSSAGSSEKEKNKTDESSK